MTKVPNADIVVCEWEVSRTQSNRSDRVPIQLWCRKRATVVYDTHAPYTEKINGNCTAERLLEVSAFVSVFRLRAFVHLESKRYLLIITSRKEANLPISSSGYILRKYMCPIDLLEHASECACGIGTTRKTKDANLVSMGICDGDSAHRKDQNLWFTDNFA